MSEILDQHGKAKTYEVLLTKDEMQHIANGIAAFMNVMHQRKVQISPPQVMSLVSAMEKFKAALAKKKTKISLEL